MDHRRHRRHRQLPGRRARMEHPDRPGRRRDRSCSVWSPPGPAAPLVGGTRNRRVDTLHHPPPAHHRPACDSRARTGSAKRASASGLHPRAWAPPDPAIAARLAAGRSTRPVLNSARSAPHHQTTRSANPPRAPGPATAPCSSPRTTRRLPPARSRPLGRRATRPHHRGGRRQLRRPHRHTERRHRIRTVSPTPRYASRSSQRHEPQVLTIARHRPPDAYRGSVHRSLHGPP